MDDTVRVLALVGDTGGCVLVVLCLDFQSSNLKDGAEFVGDSIPLSAIVLLTLRTPH